MQLQQNCSQLLLEHDLTSEKEAIAVLFQVLSPSTTLPVEAAGSGLLLPSRALSQRHV